ncbi:MAG: FIST N-terminal domain-containing protein [Flavobacteriales bacterium]
MERDQATDLHTDLKVSHGSNGGWEEFGPIRQATRSQGNVLFELDIQPAVVFRRIHPT